MANYTTVITDAGAALLTRIANAAGTLQFRSVKCGSGQIGAGDPTDLTDIITLKQTFNSIDVKMDGSGNPYEYFVADNDGLLVGYTRWEIGIFAREINDASDTLLIYLYAPTEGDADYIPPESESASVITFRVQVAQANGLTATVNIDQSTVFLDLDRWADHLDGAEGVDQHPVATVSVPGLMSAADKTKIDDHINTTTPTKGTAIHGVATTSVAGFESAADKTKLDGIAAGAEVNQNAFSTVKVGATNIAADSKTDTVEIAAGANIVLTPDATNDKVTIGVTGVAQSGHVGSGGSEHADATTTVDGFMTAADKTKLNGIATGAEVNQNAFSTVKVGATNIAADSKTDTVEIAAGANIVLTPDATNDKVTIATSDQVVLLDRLGATGTSGVADWNDITNTKPGTGPILLYGDASNGPGSHLWFHVFNIEYGTKDGSGNITQFAIPYSSSSSITAGLYVRGRYSGAWGAWQHIWHSGNDGSGSGLDADLLDGQEASAFAPSGHVGTGGSAHADVTTSVDGFMTAADKTKLNGIASGAEVNQNAFSTVKVGATNIAADSKTDTLELVAGKNIEITPDATNDKATISAPDLGGYTIKWKETSGTDIAGFSSAYKIGTFISPSGGFYLPAANGNNNWMLSIRVKALAGGAISIPAPKYVNTPRCFVDGVEKTLSSGAFAWTAVAGNTYLVQFTLSMYVDTDNSGMTVIGNWIDDTKITFDSFP
ncbi:MAG: pyocin knob domain-containing protein [Armatimonadota bacterium]|nr:pyocin knob domain-containing protein [bacterium]